MSITAVQQEEIDRYKHNGMFTPMYVMMAILGAGEFGFWALIMIWGLGGLAGVTLPGFEYGFSNAPHDYFGASHFVAGVLMYTAWCISITAYILSPNKHRSACSRFVITIFFFIGTYLSLLAIMRILKLR